MMVRDGGEWHDSPLFTERWLMRYEVLLFPMSIKSSMTSHHYVQEIVKLHSIQYLTALQAQEEVT